MGRRRSRSANAGFKQQLAAVAADYKRIVDADAPAFSEREAERNLSGGASSPPMASSPPLKAGARHKPRDVSE